MAGGKKIVESQTGKGKSRKCAGCRRDVQTHSAGVPGERTAWRNAWNGA